MLKGNKMLTSSAISWIIISFVTRKYQKTQKKWWKSMKIANIDKESLHIFWMNWGFSLKFSGKMWLIIILKVTKK